MKRVITGFYKHYKGTQYRVFGVANHTENHKQFVIYGDSNKKMWARPLKMFFGKVSVGGKEVPRFTYCYKDGNDRT